MDDLHAENDDKGGECPTGITHYLGKSKSHSMSRERVINAEHTIVAIATGYEKVEVNSNHCQEPQHDIACALPDKEPLSHPAQ